MDDLDELPIICRKIIVAGRVWVVETVEDQDALLGVAEGRALFPFGLMLWESAVALAEEMAERGDRMRGLTVLELGCGLGLSGVVAAAYGAHVTQTDHDAGALAACTRTAELNGGVGITRELGDWNDWRVPGRFDVILGADISYDAADHAAVLDVLACALAPVGTVLLADPGRTALAAFITLSRESGWDVSTRSREVADVGANAGARRVAITILSLTRM